MKIKINEKETIVGGKVIKGNKRVMVRRIKRQMIEMGNKEQAISYRKAYKDAEKKKCPRCNGNGWIAHYEYVAQGICYKCGGTKVVSKKQIKENYMSLFLISDKEIELLSRITIEDARKEFKIARTSRKWQKWELLESNSIIKEGEF